jgi:hypothetical protein
MMSCAVAVCRCAAVFLALALVLGPSFQFADGDDLRRGQFQSASFMAVGSESDLDGSRFARRLNGSITEIDFVSPALCPASFRFRTAVYSPTAARKLYQLNAVFLI